MTAYAGAPTPASPQCQPPRPPPRHGRSGTPSGQDPAPDSSPPGRDGRFATLVSRVEARSQAERGAPARGNGHPTRVCPDFHAAVELVGRRWTGAILWALAERPHFFAELTQAVPGVSDRLLSRRLRELESEGLVERAVHHGTPARVSYALTEKGRALEPALRELRSWAKSWNSSS
jgi:DNA-binding HxlR family transcriptional regulator